MSPRLDIELTSRREDGSWTWRAAGAKQPKGLLDGELAPSDAAAGDVLRVDAAFEIDGIFVTAVLPPKARSGRPPSERIELLGTFERKEAQRKETSTAASSATDAPDRGSPKRGADGQRKRDRGGNRNTQGARGTRESQRRRREASTDAVPGGERDEQRPRRRRDGPKRDSSDRSASQTRHDSAQPKPESPDSPSRPRAPKLRPGRMHREALFASLPAEQRIVAEQVARGGLAAVRAEIAEQNRRAAAAGASEVPADGLLSLAESLVGRVQMAEWRDRADAALAGIDRVDLRDLRSVVVAAEDFARDAQTRELAETIRAGLNRRVEQSQQEWHLELRETLAQGRVVRALRLSSRPPKAGAPLPPEIAEELTSQANAALGTGNSQHRIAVVLEAAAFSPIRPYIVLPNIPAAPAEELLEAARKFASRLPEVAAALGVAPAPASRRRPKRSGRRHADVENADAENADAENADAGESAPDAEDVAVQELAHPH
ncbi:hypothetical protein [Candidatus Poriferisodalis sp.]|uniref:hypothetical protein n=1 Tax=Candidatus Poriferisodalis sp. TaxID=3101277 RepID=UPI003B01B5A9